MTADPDHLIPILEAKLRNVSAAIVNKPPLCSGTWETPSQRPLSPTLLQNRHMKAHHGVLTSPHFLLPRWLDLLNATEAQLELLANACAPATFGADNKDVLDLSYCKARKMDVTDFMSRFDGDGLGLSEFVHGQLLAECVHVAWNRKGHIAQMNARVAITFHPSDTRPQDLFQDIYCIGTYISTFHWSIRHSRN